MSGVTLLSGAAGPPGVRRRRRVRARVAAFLTGGLEFRGYRPSWVARQVALAGAFSLVVSSLAQFALYVGGRTHLPFGQVWLVITAVLLLQWSLRTVRVPPPSPAPPEDSAATDLRDRPYPLAERWERRLLVTNDDPEWYSWVVRDRMTALVAERLRQRHGVRLATDPDRSRAILGDELYRFLTAPLDRTPNPAGLSRLVARMEEI